MHESELNEVIDTTGQVKISGIETLEFIITNIVPGKESKSAKRLQYNMKIKTEAYHPDFWKNYNTLKLTPLDEKLIHDLEKEISLQDQFKHQE